jgi:hypothetical protein
MTWEQVRADEVGSGDRVLYRSARVVESVYGNEINVSLTFVNEPGADWPTETVDFARGRRVWRERV